MQLKVEEEIEEHINLRVIGTFLWENVMYLRMAVPVF